MTLDELKEIVDDLVARGYGDLGVVYRDEETDPDLDVETAYFDEEADRFIIRGFDF